SGANVISCSYFTIMRGIFNMNTPINKETYILDDSIAFELMDLLKAKARHFIQLNEYVYRLFDGQSVVTFTTLENNIQVEMVKG
ncbi:DUF1655 domain-containing protein, partial [Streptomyces sp. NPDC051453]